MATGAGLEPATTWIMVGEEGAPGAVEGRPRLHRAIGFAGWKSVLADGKRQPQCVYLWLVGGTLFASTSSLFLASS